MIKHPGETTLTGAFRYNTERLRLEYWDKYSEKWIRCHPNIILFLLYNGARVFSFSATWCEPTQED